MRPPRFPLTRDSAVILGGLLLLLFATPVAGWWAQPALGWLTPYGLWLLVIFGSALIAQRDDGDES